MTDKPTPQIDKFRDLARKLNADEDTFKAKLRKVATARRRPEKPAKR